MTALTMNSVARYQIGQRTVGEKFFHYAPRGFQPWEIQQITSLAVGESLVVREHSIRRIPDKRLDAADASGFFVGFAVVALGLGWIARSAWHALSAHDWLFSAACWLANTVATLMAELFNMVLEATPPTLVWIGFLLVCVSSSLVLALAVITGEYVAEAVDAILKSNSPGSGTAAMVDLCAPVFAAAAGASCLESGISVEVSSIGAGAVLVLGLLASRYFVQDK